MTLQALITLAGKAAARELYRAAAAAAERSRGFGLVQVVVVIVDSSVFIS